MSACKALNSSWEVSHLEYVILTDCVSDAAKIRGRGTEEALNARPTLRSQFCQSVSCVVVDTPLCLILFLLHRNLLYYVWKMHQQASDSDGLGHTSLVPGGTITCLMTF